MSTLRVSNNNSSENTENFNNPEQQDYNPNSSQQETETTENIFESRDTDMVIDEQSNKTRTALSLSPELINLMTSPEISDFIETREIKSEDISLIQSALEIPKRIYIENHNTASLKRDRLNEYLQREITVLQEKMDKNEPDNPLYDANLRYTQLMLEVCEKYDWETAWNLNSVMEKVLPKEIK